jgi:predicted peptidase
VITDVSDKTQATAMHINYSAELKAVKGIPDQYFVEGRAAAGQLTVFGSEPGERTTTRSGKRSGSRGRPA